MNSTARSNARCRQESRVLTWSLRNIQNFVYNSCLFEFEDIISEVDSADIFAPPQYNLFNRVINKAVASKPRLMKPLPLTSVNPYVKSEKLQKDYDIYFVTLDFPWYVSSLNLLKGWRKQCEFAVCYIIEIWDEDLPKMTGFMDFFNQFDLICLGTHNALEKIQGMTDTPCMYLPPGIDTLKFYPNFSEKSRRPIDVCSLGRRSSVTHSALADKAAKEDFFYYHELTTGSVLRVEDHQAHRTLIANLLKNSRYYITNYAKANLPKLTASAHEIGYRFFEGAAAGNIMIGAPPKGDLFRQYFDWEDAVIPISFNEPNIGAILDEIDATPGYVERIRARNVMNSLLKHDWVYRWEQVLQKLGLPSSQGIENRKQRLTEMALALEPKVRSLSDTAPIAAVEQPSATAALAS